MSLLQRLVDNVDRDELTRDTAIPVLYFWGALCALASGQITRAQLRGLFSLSDTGLDDTELTWLINAYNGASDKTWFMLNLLAIFVAQENSEWAPKLNKAAVQAWLTAAQTAP